MQPDWLAVVREVLPACVLSHGQTIERYVISHMCDLASRSCLGMCTCRVGVNRYNFLLESLTDLDNRYGHSAGSQIQLQQWVQPMCGESMPLMYAHNALYAWHAVGIIAHGTGSRDVRRLDLQLAVRPPMRHAAVTAALLLFLRSFRARGSRLLVLKGKPVRETAAAMFLLSLPWCHRMLRQ